MKPIRYILNAAGEPEPCADLLTWAHWFEHGPRVIAQDQDEAEGAPDICVSTVFLGIDHNFSAEGPPVLWETLVFGGALDGEGRRYTSRAEALAGHQSMCAVVAAAARHLKIPK